MVYMRGSIVRSQTYYHFNSVIFQCVENTCPKCWCRARIQWCWSVLDWHWRFLFLSLWKILVIVKTLLWMGCPSSSHHFCCLVGNGLWVATPALLRLCLVWQRLVMCKRHLQGLRAEQRVPKATSQSALGLCCFARFFTLFIYLKPRPSSLCSFKSLQPTKPGTARCILSHGPPPEETRPRKQKL